jgi:acylpyruvate hydrolase
MKLVTYVRREKPSVGALCDGRLVDLRRAHRALRLRQGEPAESADEMTSADLVGFLRDGTRSLDAAREALSFFRSHGASGLDRCSHRVSEVRLLSPVPRPGKIVCVGLNYRSHLAEIGEPAPDYPILFLKPATSVVGDGDAVVLPRVSGQVDFEGELAVVIGRRAKSVALDDALGYVAGYTCANDVSAHDIEFRTSQWTSGKMLDTFCPLGPALLTSDEVVDPARLRLRTVVNGSTVQDGRADDMVFSIPFLVSYVSSLSTLEPGDVLLTGTPAGIGCNRKPPVFLRAGDRVSVEAEGIGVLTNPVVAEEAR